MYIYIYIYIYMCVSIYLSICVYIHMIIQTTWTCAPCTSWVKECSEAYKRGRIKKHKMILVRMNIISFLITLYMINNIYNDFGFGGIKRPFWYDPVWYDPVCVPPKCGSGASFRKGGRCGWRPSSSSNSSIRVVRAQIYRFELFELTLIVKLD